ncbi:SOS response-associated peptidase [Flavobacterium mesophilum]|uniref:SOS response-associated peptidase n=1 Tax=Flavobacterium mesophilum TaxID=3143495 RepID=UPI0031D7421F
MCFFTQQNAPAKNVKQRFNADIDNEENYLQANELNGFTFPNIPIILNTTPKLITTDFTWGLLPFWAKAEEFRKNTLNARIETIDEKASFRNITQNRCLIIATGYYEWHWNDSKGNTKDKYQINSQDDEIFTFAGLYTKWKNPVTGEIKNTYTMVTTEANELMSNIHNHGKRMPIMLKRKDEIAWLDSSIKISDFAYPYEANLEAINLNNNRNYELF